MVVQLLQRKRTVAGEAEGPRLSGSRGVPFLLLSPPSLPPVQTTGQAAIGGEKDTQRERDRQKGGKGP